MAISGHKRDPVAGGQAERLHECTQCGSELVYPVEWEQTGVKQWTVLRRCPNCQAIMAGRHGQAVVDAFDQELDQGAEALMRDLERLARANMADAVDRFVRALAADAILPEDF